MIPDHHGRRDETTRLHRLPLGFQWALSDKVPASTRLCRRRIGTSCGLRRAPMLFLVLDLLISNASAD
jgi:hypothetical protein